ncbi:hypothetical protein TRIUR3_31741 [Triticum urartu]|uniref:Uncharacterized protein n=1 Tax=Triticum urartu TaxID=4572 RepID=M7ZM06_TRIUA|nr:hypothetical protein TRIUR3_31741 [Triticum urartu]
MSPFASSNHMQGFRYNEESNNYAPQQFYSPPNHIPQHQEMLPMELNGPPFGQPTPSTQVPTQDDFDDIDKLTLLSLEFTWSAEDDPIRPVILEEMKKIMSGKELVEEILHIQEEILEVKEQDGTELECPSDQDEDPLPITPGEVKEVVVDEDEEPEIHLPIVIQECDLLGSFNPLNDMSPYDLFATTLHCMMPSLKIDLKTHLLGYDDIYPVSGSTLICDDHSYFPRASPMLNYKYHPHVSIELVDSYHTCHVLYSYAYVLGYSIDDLEGITPFTCMVSFVECSFRFEVTFLGTPVDLEHGEEEKQWAHTRKREAGACTRIESMRIEKQKQGSHNARDVVGVYHVLWIGGSVKSAQRHYKLQDSDKLAIEKREGQERSEERELSEKN